jgi:hypothetical protein
MTQPTKISKENWQLSVDKWEGIVDNIKNNIYCNDKLLTKCGYCREFHIKKEGRPDCDKCTLKQRKLCYFRPRSSLAFWELDENTYWDDVAKEKKGKNIELSTRILTAILADGKKWGYVK